MCPIGQSPSDINHADFSEFESLFRKGYTVSPDVVVFTDKETDLDLIARFRTLTPVELREIFEEVYKFNSPVGQTVTEQLETLARTVVTLNGSPLAMSKVEVDEFFSKNDRYPSPLEMARYVMQDKIRSVVIIDALFSKYVEYAEEVIKNFEDLKKNSKTTDT